MKTKMLIAVLAIMAACCATPAWAQFCNVKGRVKDKDGSPVVGATVEFLNTGNGRKFPLKTDSRGDYYSITIPIGTYDITVKKGDEVVAKILAAPISAGTGPISARENVHDFNLGEMPEGSSASPADAKEAAKQAAAIKEQNAKEEQTVKNLNDTLKAAKEAEDKGAFDDAIRMLTQATQADSTRDVVWGQLGFAYYGAGKKAQIAGDKTTATSNLQQAVTALKKAIEIKSDNASYHSLLAQSYSRLGKLPETKQEYEIAAQDDPPGAARYYFGIGAAMTNAGHTDEANAAFDKTIAADPKFAEAYYQKAVNLLANAKLDEKTGMPIAPPEVSANLQKYLELAPNGPNAQPAKDILATLGTKVQTDLGTKSKKKKQ
jgi:tetratricopeptide (TPR) repeat protein